MNVRHKAKIHHRLLNGHQAAYGKDFQIYAYFDQLTHRHRIYRWPNLLLFPGQDWRGESLTYTGHSGTDFILPIGTPIRAMASGVVKKIHTDGRGGLTVFVDHGGGIATSYRHLQTVSQNCEAILQRGQVIGLSGNSGIIRWSSGLIPPHLHITLWVDGLPTDLYRPLNQSDTVSYWIKDNEPHFPSPSDTHWDFTGLWLLKSRQEVAQYLSVHHSIAWVNFSHYFWRLVPKQLSVKDITASRPLLSLPFCLVE
jgi:murein DD-endopeptidase MepM/ murein hydrolase activator NlpD